MIELEGDIWADLPVEPGPEVAVVITTNGSVNKKGEAVMGRGIALEAKQRFPTLALELGRVLSTTGNHVYGFSWPEIEYHLITLPVKHQWFEKADLELIEKGLTFIKTYATMFDEIRLPRPGCGNGRLNWSQVKPLVESLPDKFIVYHKQGEK